MLAPNVPPPEDYYQNNCRLVCTEILSRQAHLLKRAERSGLQAFLAAGDGAQRLFARILSRKGPWLRLDTLSYAEVRDSEVACAELAAAGLIAVDAQAPADRLLRLLRKAELAALASALGALRPARARALRKDALIEALLNRRTDARLRSTLARHVTWISLADPVLWDNVCVWYFGDAMQDWSTFVMRDLGMIAYETVPLTAHHFEDRQAFDRDTRYRRLSGFSHRLEEYPTIAEELGEALAAPSGDRWSERRRERALLRLARWQERHALLDPALRSYASVNRHPARERTARILKKLGREDASRAVLTAIRSAPWHDEERQFAERFGTRQRRGHGQPPTVTLEIPAVDPCMRIEEQALLTLAKSRAVAWGVHCENTLVRTLTGLRYWEALFHPVRGAFTRPFQTAPNDLYFEDFAEQRTEVLAEIETRTQDDAELTAHLLTMADAKASLASGLVSWALLDRVPLPVLLDTIPPDHIRRLTAYQIRNLFQRRAGFPDLLVAYADGSYEFLEVKGPNDQLQPGQRVWFARLAELALPARVLKLRVSAGA